MKKLWIICLLLLAGCSEEAHYTYKQDGQVAMQQTIDALLKKHHIAQAYIVQFQDELLVAAQVEPLRRFQKQSIESRLKKALEQELRNNKVFVSTDYKIWLELRRTDKLTAKEKERITSLAEEET